MTDTHLTLNTGARFPVVGQGFWKVENAEAAQVAYEAIEVGYRHLDLACDYGNEVEVGEGIRRALDDGLCAREDLWITSKLWNTYHAKDKVRPAIEKSLNDLGLDYLDLYLVHFPIAQRYVAIEERYPPGWFFDPEADNPRIELAPVTLHETWGAMEALEKAGLTRSIGISNFNTGLLRDFLNGVTIRPAVHQVESHPYLVQGKLLRLCQEEEIALTAFSPLGAQSYYSIGMADPSESLLERPDLKAIAARVGRSPAQVALRWGVQRGTAVIPKSSKKARLVENLSLFDFELSEAEMDTLNAMDQHKRFNDPGVFGEKAFNRFLPIYD